jgi:hypothetical protein
MLKGTYVFKQDGKEVGRSENIITNNGKNAILQYLSGSLQEWASSLAVGTINTTPTASDLTLKYEIARSAITLKSYKVGSPNLLIVKGTLDASIAANIYEVGVFPITTAKVFGKRDTLIITDFSSPSDWSASAGTKTNIAYAAQSSVSPRVGLYSLDLAASTTITNPNFFLDLSSYTQVDTLDLLVNVPSGKSGTVRVTLTDIAGASFYRDYTFNASTLSGYQVLSQNFPTSVSTLSTVSSVSIQTIGSSSEIIVDALRVSVLNEVTNSAGLISRSVLTTPIAKIYGVPLDIEYYLQLS